jgi:hypothetical protein
MNVWGYPWGEEVEGLRELEKDEGYEDVMDVALIHSYVWQGRHKYPGAPASSNIKSLREKLIGYDVAVFGDNHDGFTSSSGDCVVYNCGCLIRRKSDERHYKPAVGLLYEDGKVGRHFLDTSEDRWIDEEDVPTESSPDGLDDFIEELKGLDVVAGLDYRGELLRYIKDHGVSDSTKRELLDAMGE